MPRVILLGASNVTLSFPRLWHGLQRAFDDPLKLFAAHGHGRSFGMWTRIGPRELPSVVDCRIWGTPRGSTVAERTAASARHRHRQRHLVRR